jgi:acetolactate synthase regulatory subunit
MRICERHPNEWVALADVELGSAGEITAGQLVAHDRSMKQLMKQLDASSDCVEVTCVHTAGRSLHRPRVEITDEIRDLLRYRR